MTDIAHYFAQELSEHEKAISASRMALLAPFAQLVALCQESLKSGGKILLFGNGGSAAAAQHLATELVVRYRKTRPAIPALALSADTATLTAVSSEFNFDDLFSRQIEALGRKGDIAIGISATGTSPNVLKALATARAMGLTTVGFGGGIGGKLPELCDLALIVPATTGARIQECHVLIGHMLCGALETTQMASA